MWRHCAAGFIAESADVSGKQRTREGPGMFVAVIAEHEPIDSTPIQLGGLVGHCFVARRRSEYGERPSAGSRCARQRTSQGAQTCFGVACRFVRLHGQRLQRMGKLLLSEESLFRGGW